MRVSSQPSWWDLGGWDLFSTHLISIKWAAKYVLMPAIMEWYYLLREIPKHLSLFYIVISRLETVSDFCRNRYLLDCVVMALEYLPKWPVPPWGGFYAPRSHVRKHKLHVNMRPPYPRFTGLLRKALLLGIQKPCDLFTRFSVISPSAPLSTTVISGLTFRGEQEKRYRLVHPLGS